MRDDGRWIEVAVKVVLFVAAILAVAGLVVGSIVGYHFLEKYW